MQLEREFKMWPLCKVLSVCSRSGEKWLWEENKGHLTVSPGLEQLHFYCTKSAMLEYHVNLFPGQLWLSQNGNKAMDFLCKIATGWRQVLPHDSWVLAAIVNNLWAWVAFQVKLSDSGAGGTKQMFIVSREEGSGLTLLFPSLVKW